MGNLVWLTKMGLPGIRYRLSHRDMETGLWVFKVFHKDNPKHVVEFKVKKVDSLEVTAKLRGANFDFIEKREQQALAARKQRLEQRTKEFDRAVQAGGEWEPERAKETYGVTETDESSGDGGDREGSPFGYQESSGSSQARKTVGSKASVGKPRSGSKGRGRRAKPKADGAN